MEIGRCCDIKLLAVFWLCEEVFYSDQGRMSNISATLRPGFRNIGDSRHACFLKRPIVF